MTEGSLGVAMTMRAYTCPLCGRKFIRQGPDLIFLRDTVCDECLAELGPLDEAALRDEITRRLAERPSLPTQS